MAQIAIVRIGNEHFREYAIEPGDNLVSICLRFGHRDWRNVYNHPANAAFRARFPDPNQIDFVNPVNLFVPLQGASTSGRSARGRPIGEYIIVNVVDSIGNPIANEALWLRAPQPAPVITPIYNSITTDANGEYILSNPSPGDWHLVSAGYWLKDPMDGTVPPGPVDVETLIDPGTSQVVPPMEIPLTCNAVTTVETHPVFYIICPMCGRTFLTVKPFLSPTLNICPNDGFDLSTIEDEIEADPSSFTSPATGQSLAASGVVCRGTQTLATVLSSVTVYWDESRFVNTNGGNYTLWGRSPAGVVKTASIVGRTTWGAGPPVLSGGRLWSFQDTALGASPPYTSRSIPSNETTPLRSVFLWMTVHHTTDSASNSYTTARDVQTKHQTERGYADIGYHYVIDANGAIYEGRPLGVKGSHAELFNGGNVGIVLAGDFESRAGNVWDPDVPTTAALNALDNLVDVLALRFDIQSVWSHQERKNQAGAGNTECPGDNLITHVHSVLRAGYPGPPP